MAKSYITATPIGLGGVEAAKQKLAGSKMFSADDWNKFLAQGRISEYVQTLTDFEKNIDYEQFEAGLGYGVKYLTGDQKLLAMENALYGNKTDKVEKSKTITNEDGSTFEQKYETTEHDYVQNLLQNQIAFNKADQLEKERLSLRESRDKVGDVFKAIPQGLEEGVISLVGDVYNIFEGISRAVDTATKIALSPNSVHENALAEMDKAFKSAFTDTGWDDTVIKWLQDNLFLYEEGDYATGFARYTYSAAESFGRIVPGMILNGIGQLGNISGVVAQGLAKTAQVAYYTGMASGNMKELFSDPTMTTRPTLELIANAAIKTGFEIGVEKALGSMFGTTSLDNMAFGYGTKASSSITGKNAVMRIFKDAFQEGMEEYFQDYSAYFTDQVFGIWAQDYKGCSDWTLQGAFDAFVLGAAMSLGGSLIRVATTKRVSTGEIDEKTGKYKRFGKFKSYEYNLTLRSMFDTINETDWSKMSAQEQASVVGGIYTTMRAITSLYGEFGEERMQVAEKILQRLQEGEVVSKADVSDSISKLTLELQLGKTGYEQAKKLSNIAAIERVIRGEESKNTQELAEKIKELKMSGEVQVVKQTDTKQDIAERLDVSDDVVNTIQRLLGGTGKDLVIVENGTGLVETETSVIAARQCLEDFDGDTNMRTLSEQRIIKAVLTDNELSDAFSEIREVMVGPNGTPYTQQQFMTMLLYDENFAYAVLYNGDKDLVNLISRLDYLANFLAKDRAIDGITKKDIDIIKERLHKVLYNFYKGAPYITQGDVEQSTILSTSEKRQLKANNWQRGIYANIMDHNELPSSEDLNVLEIMVNAYKADPETKAKLLSDLKSQNIATVKVALNKLVTQFETNFKGVYNGHIYLEYDGNPLKAEFNTFLKQHNVTIDQILEGNVDPSIAAEIVKVQGSVTPTSCVKYFQDFYKNEYRHEFTADFVNSTVIVKEGTARSYGTKGALQRATDISADQDYEAGTSLIKKSYNLPYNIFGKDVTKFEKTNATIDDVVKDPALQSEQVKAAVKERYNDNSPMHTFMYLRDYIFNKSGGTETILVDNNGNYYIATIEGSDKVAGASLNSDAKFAAINDVITDVLSDPIDGSEDIDITGIISKKYLAVFGKDNAPMITIEAMSYRENGEIVIDRSTYGYYDEDSNTIVINANAFRQAGDGLSAKEALEYNRKQFRWTVLHEFRHALQTINGQTLGFGEFLPQLARKNRAGAEAIIKDIRKHFPSAFGKDYNYKKDMAIADQILYQLSGEMGAIGYERELGMYPLAIQRTATGKIQKIIMPWGTEYNQNGIIGQKVGSKSLKFHEGVGYTMSVNNVVSDSDMFRKIQLAVRQELSKELSRQGWDFNTLNASRVITGMLTNAQDLRSPDVYTKTWNDIEQTTGMKFSRDVRSLWMNYKNLSKLQQLTLQMFPNALPSEVETEFLPMAVLTTDWNRAIGDYAVLNITGSNIKEAVFQLKHKGVIREDAKVSVTVKLVSIASLYNGLADDVTVKLMIDAVTIPVTKTLSIDSYIRNKKIHIFGIEGITEFANKVLSTYSDPSSRKTRVDVDSVNHTLGKLSWDIQDDIHKSTALSFEEWYERKKNKIKCEKAELAHKTLFANSVDSAQHHTQFMQYLRDVFDVQQSKLLVKYMWDSGAMSASDPRAKSALKAKLIAEINATPGMYRKMMNIARFQIAPMLSYDEFMNMDMPFVRITTQTESGYRAFSGASLGIIDLDTQLGLTRKTNTPLKLYMGTVKPKQGLGYTPSGEFEILLPTDIIQSADKYTVVLTDSEFYLLGEEYGDIANQLRGVDMVSAEGVTLDSSFSFSKSTLGRPRYVSHEAAQGSNLRYYVKKGEVLQMDPRLQDMNVKSTGIEDTLDNRFVKLIKAGKVKTKSDLYAYITKAWTAESYQKANKENRAKLEATFKLINDTYFGNTAIPNLKSLLVLMELGMDDYYAARATVLKYAEEHPQNTEIPKLLTASTTAKGLHDVINYIKNNPALKASFNEFTVAFNLYRGFEPIDLDVGRKKWLIPMLARYDGTLESAGIIASNVRWTSILEMQNVYKGAKAGKEGDTEFTFEESFADDGSNNISGITKTEEKYDWLLDYYVDKDLEGKSWNSTAARIKAANKLRQEYIAKFENFSDAEIDALYNDAVNSESVGRIVKSDQMLEEVKGKKVLTVRNTYEHARNTARNIIRKLTAQQLEAFVDKHPDLGISKDGKFTYPDMQKIGPTMGLSGAQNILLARRDFNAKLDEAYQEVLDGKYGTKAEQRLIASQKKRIAKLEADLEAALQAKGKEVQLIIEGDGTISAADTTAIPDVLQKVFDTEFSTTAKTEVKYLSEENEVHFKRNYETFVDQNAEALMDLDEANIDNILNFYEKYALAPSGTASDTYAKFNAIRQYMLMYLYKLGEDNLIPLSDVNKKRIETMFKAIKSGAGTDLSISRTAQEIINPTAVILKSLQRIYGIDVDDQDIDDLRMVVKRDYTQQAKAAGITAEEYRVQELNKILRKIEKDALVKIQGKPRNKVDTILKWQRAAMLSSIGTWTRNIASNVLLDITNKASDTLGDATFGLLDKITKGSQKRNLPSDQYQITGTKLDKNNASDKVVIDWIDKTVRASGIMELVADGLTKYDASITAHKSSAPSEILAQLIANSTISKLTNQNSFPEGNHWWTKAIGKTGNAMAQLLYGYTDKNGKVHQGVMTDTKSVMKSFYSYLGKMIKEDLASGRIDANELNKGLNSRMMLDIVSNAYVMASWDYMHKANFFNKLDGLIRKYTGDGGYFIWKQFEPFAAAGWNWFMKGLEYTPIGLGKAILNYIKLEKFANKMDLKAQEQVAPSGRFATYLVKRQIGSGIIGTIGTIAGALLVGMGVAGIDDDDGKPKLYVGNVAIDISNVFGTSGILAGIAMGGAFVQAKSKNQSWLEAVIEGMVSATDSMFIDSVFSDMFDLMQSREVFTEVLMNKAGSSFAMFVPNIFKTAMSYSTVVSPKYASGILGQLERQMVQILPSLAYALPRRYDIYTGELQYKYNMPWMDRWYAAIAGVAVNYGTPVKVKRRTTSQYEVLATSLGVTKGELTGKYKDIGNLTTQQIGQLNLYYGQLNNTSLEKFVNNKEKYYVENEQGKRVNLYYNQMTDKQKKSVITRIMSDNAKYAKIYMGTRMGYKYYANEEEFKALRQLGIANVYKKTKQYDGFVK